MNPDELAQLFEDYMNKTLSGVLLGCIGRIESHDVLTMRAVVTPLLRYKDEISDTTKKYEPIPDVPVQMIYAGGYYIRPEYVSGDLVWLSFSTYETSSGTRGNYADTDGAMFPRSACSVVNGILPKTTIPTLGFLESGLCGGHIDGAFSFQFGKTGMKIKGDLTIEGDITQTGSITTSGDVDVVGEVTAKKTTAPVKLSGHTHMSPTGETNIPTPEVL